MGKVISFEGLDLVGKTTQIALLMEWFISQKVPVSCRREEGKFSTDPDLLRGLARHNIDPLEIDTNLLLYLAQTLSSRAIFESVRCSKTEVLIVDRAIDTCIVYALSGDRGKESERFWERVNEALDDYGPEPDLTFLLTAPLETRWERIQAKYQNGLNWKPDYAFFINQHNKLHQRFAFRALNEPHRFRIIDTRDKDIHAVHEDIVKILKAEKENGRL